MTSLPAIIDEQSAGRFSPGHDHLRLDGGFACPALFAYLDSVPCLEYVCGLAKNAVLERLAQPLFGPGA